MSYDDWRYAFSLEWEMIAHVSAMPPAEQLRTWFATDQRAYVSDEHAARVDDLRTLAGIR